MAAKRGDEFVESKSKSESSMKHEIEVDIPETRDQANSLINYMDANGDQSLLIDPELSENRNETIFDGLEHYTSFQKITTIPAASLSIVAGFIMIASVRRTKDLLDEK